LGGRYVHCVAKTVGGGWRTFSETDVAPQS
jgi:hypothetical protein